MTEDRHPTPVSGRLAVGAMVCAVLSVLLGPLIVGLLFAVPAFVLGGFALVRAAAVPPRASRPRLAIIAIIIAALGCVLAVGAIVIYQPAVALLRLHAAQVQDENKLRVLYATLSAYAADHEDRLPPSFAALLAPPRYLVSTTTLVSAWSHTLPLDVPAEVTDAAALEPVLEQHADFTLSAPGVVIHNVPHPAEVVLVYSNLTYGGRGRLVLFMDGHAEFVPAQRLAEAEQLSNAARREVGLPAARLPQLKRE